MTTQPNSTPPNKRGFQSNRKERRAQAVQERRLQKQPFSELTRRLSYLFSELEAGLRSATAEVFPTLTPGDHEALLEFVRANFTVQAKNKVAFDLSKVPVSFVLFSLNYLTNELKFEEADCLRWVNTFMSVIETNRKTYLEEVSKKHEV